MLQILIVPKYIFIPPLDAWALGATLPRTSLECSNPNERQENLRELFVKHWELTKYQKTDG